MAAKKSSKAAHVDYDVGFGKPPVTTRFAKGQSGNPHGRPKGKSNLATILNAALNEKVTIVENGTSKQVTKMEAATKQVVNSAAAGDMKSFRLLTQLIPGMETSLAHTDMPLLSTHQDKEVLAGLLKRLQAPVDTGLAAEHPEQTHNPIKETLP